MYIVETEKVNVYMDKYVWVDLGWLNGDLVSDEMHCSRDSWRSQFPGGRLMFAATCIDLRIALFRKTAYTALASRNINVTLYTSGVSVWYVYTRPEFI